MSVNKELLRQFLIDSNNAGYAGGEERKWIKEPDGSTTIPFEKGPWKSHDNFFGGEPYGGRIIVSYENRPCWIMFYYGWVEEGVDVNPVYAVLREALKRMPTNSPFRGPKEYEENGYIYTNSWDGELDRYAGEEQITKDEKLIYKANYRGGLVDQKAGV